jgi:hypothetical protein
MSEIIKHFGQATVILFNAPFESTLPSKSQVRKLLGSGQVKYYARWGQFSDDITNLLCAHDVCSGTPSDYYWRTSDTRCTHVFVTNHQVKYNAFAGLTYGAQLVAGFNLSGDCMTTLDQLLGARGTLGQIKQSSESWASVARKNVEALAKFGYVDATVSDLDLNAIDQFAKAYGNGALAAVEDDIRSWVAQYTWA